jgi:ElaB/YqjD/DUF883 family membrane-anchored ribosome-binding protein
MSASTTADDLNETIHNGTQRLRSDGKRAAGRVKRTASAELGNLISDVEDLVKKVGHVSDVDVAQLRERLKEKLDTAKETLAEGGRRITETARDAAGATDDYVRSSPWQALGIAALAGVAVGFILSRR